MGFKRKWTPLLRVLLAPALLLALVTPTVLLTSTPVMATGITVNEYYIIQYPMPPWQDSGSGSYVVPYMTGGYYYHTTAFEIDDPGTGRNILLEARLSAVEPALGVEAGARLWFNPTVDDWKRSIEVRLIAGATSDQNVFRICGKGTDEAALTTDGQPAEIVANWAASAGDPTHNVRLMLIGQEVVLEVETFDPVLWDHSPTKQRVVAPLNTSNFPYSLTAVASQVGFGNKLGSSSTASKWEFIHLTITDDATTELPYWPPEPPAPTLVHDDKGMGNPQGIDFSADLTGSGYLTNDAVTPELDADGTTYYGETRTNPGNETWDFDGLNCDQTVYGRVVVSDVSGRSTTGPDSGTTIPPCEEPSHEVTLNLRLTEIFPGREVEPGVVRGALFVGRATYDGKMARIWCTVNYEKEEGIYTVTGGNWILTQNWRNRLFGRVTSGTVTWVDWEGSGTDIGADLEMTLSVNGGTGKFRGAKGNGSFSGYLNHEVRIPRLTGVMTLVFTLP